MNAGRGYLAGLVGTHIGPSLTPFLHEREGDRHGLRYVYKLLDLQVLGVPAPRLVRCARTLGYTGLNITHPAKRDVIDTLDTLDRTAQRVGAVNTIVFHSDGHATGHNTDVAGFAEGFRDGLPEAATGRVVLFGAGGAGAAVGDALAGLGVRRLSVVDVDRAAADALAGRLAGQYAGCAVQVVGTEDVGSAVRTADGVVNATPAGNAAHPDPPFDTRSLQPHQWVADIVFRPLRTRLLQQASAAGCRTLDGGRMATGQAVGAFELFTGRPADAVAMRRDFCELADESG